jgi:hypothetical protein
MIYLALGFILFLITDTWAFILLGIVLWMTLGKKN